MFLCKNVDTFKKYNGRIVEEFKQFNFRYVSINKLG